MRFISYPHLILLISGQTFKVTVPCEKFWELNGALARELNYRKQADWNAINKISKGSVDLHRKESSLATQ